MTTQTPNYEECYKILDLDFGATIQQVNMAWRRLSMLHHPDKHNNNPHQHQQALEYQKKINNARDVLRKWFDQNRGVAPPRTSNSTNPSQDTGSTAGSAGNSSRGTGSSSDRANNSQSTQQRSNAYKQHYSYNNHSWSYYNNQNSYKTESNHQWYYNHTTPEPKPEAFSPPEWKPTPLQKTIRTMDGWFENKESHSDPTIPAIIAFVISIFAPMYAYASTINLAFPEMVGHYPDWLSTGVAVAGIATTIYILHWYFVESELIKLQERKLQYISDKTPEALSKLLNEIINEHRREGGIWSFIKCDWGHTATMHFHEEVLPDMRRARQIEIVYRVTPTASGATLDVAFRVKSPIHSFACNKIVQGILKKLKSDLTLLS